MGAESVLFGSPSFIGRDNLAPLVQVLITVFRLLSWTLHGAVLEDGVETPGTAKCSNEDAIKNII